MREKKGGRRGKIMQGSRLEPGDTRFPAHSQIEKERLSGSAVRWLCNVCISRDATPAPRCGGHDVKVIVNGELRKKI